MRPATRTPTFKLAAARLEFSRDRRLRNTLHFSAVAAIVVLLCLIGWQLRADSRSSTAELSGLRQQNAVLQADLARTRVELELERSTRAALARQVAALNQETSELKSRLDFFNAQSGRPGKTR